MIFQKYHCAKCGATLEKERTHRVVTKDDQDYYRYHCFGKFPQRDYDVYDHRFQCPGCGARISFDEQCIIQRIQKKLGHIVLSSSEIKSEYAEGKANHRKGLLLKNILYPIVLDLIVFAIFCGSNPNRGSKDFIPIAIFFLAITAVSVAKEILRFKGTSKMKFKHSYPYEKEAQLKKLHTYSVHNRDRIAVSSKCYCFHCKAIMESREILRFADNGQTAICPKCSIDSILPDSIDEPLDKTIIVEMNEYWF